jgi:predicted  nucleic acid-binding Zn-ribbon protein
MISICTGLVFLAAVATPMHPQAPSETLSSWETTAQSLDDKINQLSHQIQTVRMKAMNLQMEAQAKLPTNWDGYAQTIEEAERNEDLARKLEKQLAELLTKKKELLKQRPAKSS